MMENILRKISGFVFLYHRLIAIFFVLLTALSLIAVLNMEIKTDIIDVLPGGNKIVTQFREFMEKYGASDHITIVVESGKNTIEDHLDIIETLAEKLKNSTLIEYVDYSILHNTGASANEPVVKYFPLYLDAAGLRQLKERLSKDGVVKQIRLNRQRLLSPLSSPLDSELISRDPLQISNIVAGSFKRSHKDDFLDLGTGFYLTKDHSSAFIFAKPKGRSRDMAFVKELKKELDSVTQAALKESGEPQDVKIQSAGAHILSEEVRQVIRHDIISSSALSVVLITLLIWMAYRVRGIILAVIGFTMLSSLLMTLAFAYIIFGSLNIVTSIVAAVLIGLYVDYSIHIVKRYSDELRRHNDRQKALEKTLVKTGSAIVVSAATTSLSFFSIIVTRFEGLHELGIVSGIGVFLCLVANIFLTSSLLIWADKEDSRKILAAREPLLGVEGLINIVTGKPRVVFFCGIIISVLLCFGLAKLRFDNDSEHIGVRNSPAVETLKAINRKMNKKGDPLCLIIKRDNIKDLTVAFDSVEKQLSAWKEQGVIGRFESLSVMLPPQYVQQTKIDEIKKMTFNNAAELKKITAVSLENNGFAYDKGYTDSYLDNIFKALNNREVIGLKELEAVSQRRLALFFNKQDLSLAAYLYPSGTEWDHHSLDVIRADAAERNWTLTGKQILFEEIKGSIIRGSTLAVLATLLINLIIVYWFFRKAVYVMLVMLPVILGFILTPAVMGLLNMPFNFINIGTIALIFGLGVDYGVYVMQAYLKEDERDLGSALRITGKNIMMCAATTVAGCGSLVTAKFTGIATIGSVLTIGATLCAAISLLMLPAILCLRKGI